MKKFVDTLNVVSGIVSIYGIAMFYQGHIFALYVCMSISLVGSFFNVTFGDQNSYATETYAAIIGVIIAAVKHKVIWPYVSVAICYESGIMLAFSAIFIVPLIIAKLYFKIKNIKM